MMLTPKDGVPTILPPQPHIFQCLTVSQSQLRTYETFEGSHVEQMLHVQVVAVQFVSQVGEPGQEKAA